MTKSARPQFNVRLGPDERILIDRLKKARGQSFNLSGWLRQVIAEAAKKELRSA